MGVFIETLSIFQVIVLGLQANLTS